MLEISIVQFFVKQAQYSIQKFSKENFMNIIENKLQSKFSIIKHGTTISWKSANALKKCKEGSIEDRNEKQLLKVWFNIFESYMKMQKSMKDKNQDQLIQMPTSAIKIERELKIRQKAR